MIKQVWQAWTKLGRSPELGTIDLVYEYMKTKDKTGRYDTYYSVFELRRNEEHFIFFLGADSKDELNGEFISDGAGTADLQCHLRWKKGMASFVTNTVREGDVGIKKILNQALTSYTILKRDPSTREEQIVPIVMTNPYIDLRFLTEIRSNDRVKVRPITNISWNIEVSIEDATVVAEVRTYSNLDGYYCTLRVLSPRLALGRNVNFGGRVVGVGLMKSSPSKNITALISAISSTLQEEVPLLCSSYNYTEEEYDASTFTREIASTGLHKFVIHPGLGLIDGSSVMMSYNVYLNLIGENQVLWLRLQNPKMEKEIWVMGYPSDMIARDNEVYVSDTIVANLCCDFGDEITISKGTLPELTGQDKIKIRLRSDDSYVQEVIGYIEKMSCLCVGATYSVPVANKSGSCSQYRNVVYFDVLEAGRRGTCSLRNFHLDINLELGDALIAPEESEEDLDPLRVDQDAYSDEEESD